MSSIYNSALEYCGYGWKVLPLKPRDKMPRLNEWQKNASSDEETVDRWFTQWPDSNLGVKLGPDSGIIDIECDDEEAEKIFASLFDGQNIVTPSFSARRGKHRLFKWHNELPNQHKNGFKIGKLEFRTGAGNMGAQSVFPPSIHPTGPQYTWLTHPSECDIAEIPDSVLAKLHNQVDNEGRPLFMQPDSHREPKSKEHWESVIKDGVSEGNRNQTAAELAGFALQSLADPYDNKAVAAQWDLFQKWNLGSLRPPLPDQELKRTFDSILSRQRRSFTEQRQQESFGKYIGGDPSEPPARPWKLVVVLSNPKLYQLYSPKWIGVDFITLNSAQLTEFRLLKREAIDQGRYYLGPDFRKLWEGAKGQPGLAERLLEQATEIAAPFELRRDVVIASKLYEAMLKAGGIKEGTSAHAKPDCFGNAVCRPNGDIIFKFDSVWTPMTRGDDRVGRNELTELLERLGCQHKVIDGARYRLMSPESMKQLRKLVEDGLQPEEPVICPEQRIPEPALAGNFRQPLSPEDQW